MNVRRLVDLKPSQVWVSWDGIQFTDGDGQVNVELTEKQIVELAKSLSDKVGRIMRERLEKAQELVKDVDND